jgi:hypothetical protein
MQKRHAAVPRAGMAIDEQVWQSIFRAENNMREQVCVGMAHPSSPRLGEGYRKI